MNPFSVPFSGTATWVDLLLAVGAAVVLVIYLYQVFLPLVQRLKGTRPDPEERAALLVDAYRKRQAPEEKS